MGRKVNSRNAQTVVKVIQEHDNKYKPADIAREAGLHPQAVARLLGVVEEVTGVLLQEDQKGRLGIFKRK